MQLVETAPRDVISRALAELIDRAGIPMDDVLDYALAIAMGMSCEIHTAVRSLLVEAPAVTGRVQ